MESEPWFGMGTHSKDLSPYSGEPHADRLQLGIWRPPFRGKTRHAGGLQGKPLAAESRARKPQSLERGIDTPACRQVGGAGGRCLGCAYTGAIHSRSL